MSRLDTERLVLRMFRESDLDAYAAMLGDPEVMRYLAPNPMTRAEAWRNMAMVLGHWQLRGFGLWALEERASGLLVGRAGCWLPEGWPGFEVGWALRRECWGRGYATEAARAAVHHAFTALGQTRVISLIRPDNARSIAVAARLGMTDCGKTDLNGNTTLIYALDRHANG
ncbi:MAG TPA: GNAT family N-acetyltransferase [Isosphaeraceae bacterium]|nr:GNAT family N-acetyltransferase [Isosphaeraceae bacterium]